MRGYSVAPIVKYKGDKAKKEFAIDNTVELNMVRGKYAETLTTDDEKKILPEFFSHIARQKGYYDPDRKAYIPHDTSMDFLQVIVRKFRTKKRMSKPTSNLYDIFDKTKYRIAHVNKKQVSHIMKYVRRYKTKLNKLYNDMYHLEKEHIQEHDVSRYELHQRLQEELVDHVNTYRIGYSTMLFIIKTLESKEHRQYKNILLPLLFTLCRQSFISAINESKGKIEYLVEPGTDLKVFDFGLKITKKD